MGHSLEEALTGREGNYILPFFWQHGEGEETLRAYMNEIRNCGIRAVCVESRPHPDYVGPGWWKDMDVIMEEAKALGMKVWVLDDAHFPTGYCNGQIQEHPEYGKRFLDHTAVDVLGPAADAAFLLNLQPGERLLGVVGAKRIGSRAGEWSEAVDLTDRVRDNQIFWDVPEGYWNVVILKETLKSGGRKDYCNLIDARAVRFFLDTVYEPHWEHYRAEFGDTFAGFFSDEPELGNTFGAYPDTGIGQTTMELPWCEELESGLRTQWGENWCVCLAALWNRLEGVWQRARLEYMNLLTNLYGVNFCGQVGEWCSAHGVEYIGHVIEDNGNHVRTGYGAGHYFKALWGQHMAGIDVVLQQIRPGYDEKSFYHIGGKNTYDGRFFHYGLAKLGVSLAHLDEKKKGRTMCEMYGAYGWSEGLKLMKWLTDHMLVRGVNWFVPHAFTPAPFPDPDCPPHFYGHGKNPQYAWFGELMKYTNRMSHLFQGGKALVETMVLYPAESGWMGNSEPFESIGKLLLQHQVDYDVVPLGVLLTMKTIPYRVLVIPDCQAVPQELTDWIKKAANHGVTILFAGSRPESISGGEGTMEPFPYWGTAENKQEPACGEPGACIFCDGDVEALLQEVEGRISARVKPEKDWPWLRCYSYLREEGVYYMLFQEHPQKPFQGGLYLPESGMAEADWYRYDPWENRLYEEKDIRNGEKELTLEPYETVVFFHGRKPEADSAQFRKTGEAVCLLDKSWRISARSYQEKSFCNWGKDQTLYNINGAEHHPDFSGVICYETAFQWREEWGDTGFADCGQVYETLELWLNGEKQGVRIAPPYRIPLKGLKEGENQLKLYVANTLVHELKDTFSATMPVEPGGLLGPVVLHRAEQSL